MLIISTYQTDFVHKQARARRLQFSACHDYNLVLVFNSTFPTSDVLRLQLSKDLPRIHILWYKNKSLWPARLVFAGDAPACTSQTARQPACVGPGLLVSSLVVPLLFF